MKAKKKGFSSLIVILCVIHIDVFIAAMFYLYYMGYGFSDTAVTCFFTFWSVEMLSLAGIKIFKTRYNQDYESSLEEVMNDEEDM